MANAYNKFLDDLKGIIETGFTVNSRQYLGTGAGGIFRVSNYKAVDTPFQVQVSRPTPDDFPMGPDIMIHSFTPNPFYLIGKTGNIYTFTIEVIFNEGHSKTVDGDVIKRDTLARYFLEEIGEGINQCRGRFTNVNVSRISYLGGVEQSGRVGNKNLYGCTIQVEAVFDKSS